MNRSLRFFTKGDKLAGCKSRRKRRCGCPDDGTNCNGVDVSWEFNEDTPGFLTIIATVSGISDSQLWSISLGSFATKGYGPGQLTMSARYRGGSITWEIVSQSRGDNPEEENICPFEYSGIYTPAGSGSGSGSGPGPEPGLFRCEGPNMITIEVTEVHEGAYVQAATSGGYYTVRGPGGIQTLPSWGYYYFSPDNGGQGLGQYCVWPSDEDGNPSGEHQWVQIMGPGLSFSAQEIESTSIALDVQGVTNSEIDLSGFPPMFNYAFLNCPNLMTIIGYDLSVCTAFNAVGSALNQTTVDDILVAAAATGNPIHVNLSGGTSASPSAVGLAAAATIISNGGTVYHN